jgi:hypothetical protein
MAFIDEKPVEDGLVKKAEKWKWGGLWHRARGIVTLGGDVGELFPRAAWWERGGG